MSGREGRNPSPASPLEQTSRPPPVAYLRAGSIIMAAFPETMRIECQVCRGTGLVPNHRARWHKPWTRLWPRLVDCPFCKGERCFVVKVKLEPKVSVK